MLLAAGALTAALSLPAAAAPVTTQLRTISGAELRRLRDSGARIDLVDVRAPADFAAVRLVGARNVPFYLIAQSGIPKERILVLYCSSAQCGLAAESARALIERGYRDVRVLEGGYEAALAAGCSVEGNVPVAETRRTLSHAELEARLSLASAPILIDARPAASYMAGHLPGAVSFPLERLEKQTPALPPGREVVVYDASGARRARAARALRAPGREVWELDGGPALWAREGRPLETGAPIR